MSSWVSVAASVTSTVEAARATVRPSRVLDRRPDLDLASGAEAFTTDVSTRTTALPSLTCGVVTYVPHRRTCTGSVTTRRASR
ncbi:hypothetical protein SCYAM73S_08185 [Streptomyces cyaneofuscatus]